MFLAQPQARDSASQGRGKSRLEVKQYTSLWRPETSPRIETSQTPGRGLVDLDPAHLVLLPSIRRGELRIALNTTIVVIVC